MPYRSPLTCHVCSVLLLTAALASAAAGTSGGILTDAAQMAVACPQESVADETVVRSRAVVISDAGRLANDASGARIVLNLFDDAVFTAVRQRVERRGPGAYSWFGSVDGFPQSQVILVADGDGLVGNIVVGLKMYQIRSACEGVQVVREIDQTAFQDEALPISLRVTSEHEAAGGPRPMVTGNPTIDVMVVYTADAATAAGGGIASVIQLGIDETNQEYANSLITQRVNLVYSYQVSYTETGDSTTDLNRLQGTSDGYMDEVHGVRDTYGADLVSLWVNNLNNNICGQAYLMTSVSTSFASNGFSVVRLSCATGYYSFGHEMGHNMGARHDWYVDGSTTPYQYSHGYAYPAGAWRTVLAYNNKCTASGTSCTRVPYFSNPGVTYNGAATGAGDSDPEPADNARTLNNTASTVAAFRDSSGGGCSYSVLPATESFAASGGGGSASVTTTSACAWTALSNDGWITVTSGASGNGSGTVGYTVGSNSDSSARIGTMTIAGQTFTVTQDGASSGAPAISGYSSKHNEPGASAKVYGTGFTSSDTVAVVFGGKNAKVKKVSSDTYVKFTIPSSLKSGKKYSLYVVVNGVASNSIKVKLD